MNDKPRQESITHLRIVTPGEHFLYLPLYFANSENYFGLIPSHYRLEVESPTKVTDERAFQMLSNRNFDLYSDIAFAVCDPTVLLQSPSIAGVSHPVVAAALVTNTAFWAVDHRTSEVQTLAELRKFKRLVSYHPGTTGHRIAQHIVREAGNGMPIDCVDMGKEILKFTESGEGTIVLSPNLLEIDDLVAARDEHQIAYVLANSPEFSNVLVSALLTRQDVILGHGELFRGVLSALAYSMSKVHQCDPDVIRYAVGRFNRSEKRIRSVMEVANRSRVLPTSLEISMPQWENAARAYFETIGHTFDQEARKFALNRFHAHIGLYSEAVRKATSGTSEKIKSDAEKALRSREARKQHRVWVFVAVTGAFGALAAATRQFPIWSVSCGGLAALSLGYSLIKVLPLRENVFARYLHAILYFGLVVSLCLYQLGIVSWPLAVSLCGILVPYWIKLGLSLGSEANRNGSQT